VRPSITSELYTDWIIQKRYTLIGLYRNYTLPPSLHTIETYLITQLFALVKSNFKVNQNDKFHLLWAHRWHVNSTSCWFSLFAAEWRIQSIFECAFSIENKICSLYVYRRTTNNWGYGE